MRVDAGSVGPGWGCTCVSSLRKNQILAAMARASLVTVEYQNTNPDGTFVFYAWTRPEDTYYVTYNPSKPGHKLCKHILACSAHIVGDWLTEGFQQLRKEMIECLTVKIENQKLHKSLIATAQAMLSVKPMPTE